MQFIRQIYDDLPDFIPIPAEFKHCKAEAIIFPLESSQQNKTTLKFMLAELAAINQSEPIEMDCPARVDRANPLLEECKKP